MPEWRSSANKIQPNFLSASVFNAWKFGLGFFGGLIFRPGIFLGFVGSPRSFGGVLIFAPIRSSPSLKTLSTPPPPSPARCHIKG